LFCATPAVWVVYFVNAMEVGCGMMSFFLIFQANFAKYVHGFLKMAAGVALMRACDYCLLASCLILIPVIARLVISVCGKSSIAVCFARASALSFPVTSSCPGTQKIEIVAPLEMTSLQALSNRVARLAQVCQRGWAGNR
jgi:hypothetical protein